MNKLFIFTVLAVVVLAVGGSIFTYKIKAQPPPDFDGDNVADSNDPDDDNDHWSDRQEREEGTDPKDPWSFPEDSDLDGLSDAYELNMMNRIKLSLSEIAERDNLSVELLDASDYFPGIYNPFNGDINGDGIKDGNEDFDLDGLVNKDEQFIGTEPFNPDTDNDTLKDGDEIFYYKSNPLSYDTDADFLRDNVDPIPDSRNKKNFLFNEDEQVSSLSPELASRLVDTDCYKLDKTIQRDSCFDSRAHLENNPDWCTYVTDNTRKDNCLKSFGIEAQSLYQG